MAKFKRGDRVVLVEPDQFEGSDYPKGTVGIANDEGDSADGNDALRVNVNGTEVIFWARNCRPVTDTQTYKPKCPWVNMDSDGRRAGVSQDNLELIQDEPIKQSIITKAMNFIKSALLSKKDKTLIKAGYLNEDLSLTSTGKSALEFINFTANKKQLVTMAEEALAEEKD